MGYFGKYTIDSGPSYPVGSTLFGVTETPASTALKIVKNTTYLGSNFTAILDGVTVHIQFKYGNTATSNLQLKIGDTTAKAITNPGGVFNWAAESIVSFTYDGTNWVVNDAGIPSALTVEDTYDPTSSNAISGKGVAEAIAPLTGGNNASAYGVDTEIGANPSTNRLPTSYAVATYVNNKFDDNKTWLYKGTLGLGGTTGALPSANYKAGWIYKIAANGTYAGQVCEEGDFILAISSATSGQTAVNNNHWAVLQGNVHNPVSGPSSATQGHVAIFGSNKQQLEDSGYTIAKSVPSDAVFTDTHYEDKGTVSAITAIEDGTEFTLASIVAGTLNIKRGLNITTATVSTGIQEVT